MYEIQTQIREQKYTLFAWPIDQTVHCTYLVTLSVCDDHLETTGRWTRHLADFSLISVGLFDEWGIYTTGVFVATVCSRLECAL